MIDFYSIYIQYTPIIKAILILVAGLIASKIIGTSFYWGTMTISIKNSG